jgi:hypothetical protein
MRGIDKERTNLCGVLVRIKFRSIALSMSIPAKKSATQTPPAATNDLTFGLNNEIRPVSDELSVHTTCPPQCFFNLLWRIVVRAQLSRRASDKISQRRLVLRSCIA